MTIKEKKQQLINKITKLINESDIFTEAEVQPTKYKTQNTIELVLIAEKLKPGTEFMTVSDICNELNLLSRLNASRALRQLNFTHTYKKINKTTTRGFLVSRICSPEEFENQ
jgi:hypothetical protein